MQNDPSTDQSQSTPENRLDVSGEERGKMGFHLGKIRQARNISQDFAAQKIGISRSHLSNIEVGRSRPGWRNLMAMASFYDVSIDTLIREVSDNGEIAPQPLPAAWTEWKDVQLEPAPRTVVGVKLSPWETYVVEGLAKLSSIERRRVIDELMQKISAVLKA